MLQNQCVKLCTFNVVLDNLLIEAVFGLFTQILVPLHSTRGAKHWFLADIFVKDNKVLYWDSVHLTESTMKDREIVVHEMVNKYGIF